jgi:hypothetical protein
MATLLNSNVGYIFMGRACATSNPNRTVRLGFFNCGTGNQKTAVGYKSQICNAGDQNTSFGSMSLMNNTGGCNTAVGFCALYSNTYGVFNTAVGVCALHANQGGCNNTGIGYRTGGSGYCSGNTLIGYKAGGIYGGLGNENTFIGKYAKSICSTDDRNVAIGCGAIAGCGDGNVAIGCGAKAYGSSAIAIGNGAYAASTIIQWGGPANNTCNCVWGSWSYTSDCRDKSDIIELDDNLGINFIRKLKPISYKYDFRNSYVLKCGFEFGTKDGTLKSEKINYGFLVQDVKQAAEELNINFDAIKYDSKRDMYKLSYSQLIASIVKTIKSIDSRIEILKTKV